MKDFYIFLDFDGTMNDIEFAKKLHDKGIKKDVTIIFNPRSVNALNYLILALGKKYNVNLVISSIWRKDMTETIFYLKQNNILINKLKNIDKTEFIYDDNNKNLRDTEIKKYLKKHHESTNYVAIDDEADEFDIPTKNKIVTNIYNDSLKISKVKRWLDTFENTNEFI